MLASSAAQATCSKQLSSLTAAVGGVGRVSGFTQLGARGQPQVATGLLWHPHTTALYSLYCKLDGSFSPQLGC
jgi:hypothetical protein